jgi:hypothetical protein
MFAMDRATQGREIRKLIAAPDYMVNSAQAITEGGVIAVASASASQIGPLASGAGRVIYVVGSQKIVPDVATAYARILEHVLPYEDARVLEAMGVHTILARVLLVEREWQADRTTVVLVREPVGV